MLINKFFIKTTCTFFILTLLTGCFTLTDKKQLPLLVAGVPFKDLTTIRLVNSSSESSKERMEKAKNCSFLMRLEANNLYQVYDCQGQKQLATKFYASPKYPNVWLFTLCNNNEHKKETCTYITLKIKSDLVFIYTPKLSDQDKTQLFSSMKNKTTDTQRLTRLALYDGSKSGKTSSKGGTPFQVKTVDDMFFLANLIAENPIKTTDVQTYVIE